jgi:DNA transposition AAA+ family ATPase
MAAKAAWINRRAIMPEAIAKDATKDAARETPRDTSRDNWTPAESEPANVSDDDLARWREVTAEVRSVAARDGLSKSEVARRSAVPMGTFSPWANGTYTGQIAAITERVAKWLRSVEEMRAKALDIPTAPDFVETATARLVVDTLLYAQMMPEMVIVTLASGLGKTTTARHFAASRPNAFLVTMRPTTAGTHSMLQELALALDVTERNPARLDRAIGLRLKRNGRHTLLMVDEAQNLADNAINQLRFFLDEYGCGIALLGNEEVYSRFGKSEPKEGYGQIHRRIGKRVRRMQPSDDDVAALLDAWALTDPSVRRLLAAIGRKPGTLGQIDKTIRLASMLAASGRQPLSAEHIKAAWADRGGGDVR